MYDALEVAETRSERIQERHSRELNHRVQSPRHQSYPDSQSVQPDSHILETTETGHKR